MGVRLNKVLTELNIGLQTAVDFLRKKSNLGEVKDDATPNTKITDDQYQALVNEFNGDKEVKTQAAQLFPKKDKKKEKKPEVITVKEEVRQSFKPLGKIDLDSIGKKPAPAAEPVEKPEPVVEKPVVEAEKKPVEEKPEPVVEKPEEKAEPVVESPVEEPVVEVEQPQTVAEETTQPEDEAEEPDDETPQVAEQPAAASTTEVFSLRSESKLAPKVNVLGKIDLSALNQSTRPKKKPPQMTMTIKRRQFVSVYM